MMRLPTSSNLGFISPIEALTNEVQNLSHLRVPFSDSYVTQAATGALECKARKGIFIGYPEHTRDGVYRHYFPSTKSVQTTLRDGRTLQLCRRHLP
jgi:hypothetical protein